MNKLAFLLGARLRCQASHILVISALALGGCGLDQADTAYMEALRAAKTGQPVARQVALIDAAIALRPDRGGYYEHRAMLRAAEKDFAAARADFDKAVVLSDRAYLRYARALSTCQEGRIKEALPDFDLAIKRQPENLQFYRGRGLARAESGDLRGARADAAFLVARVPHWHDGHWLMGRVEELEGRCKEAVPFLEKAVEIRPELVFPRRSLVRCLRKLKKTGEADAQAAELARREAGAILPYLEPFHY